MNRRLIYLWSLLGFFLMWGVFGFVAAAPRSEPDVQIAAPPGESTTVQPDSGGEALIPVTGEAQTGSSVPVGYILLGFIAVLGLLALLNAANKTSSINVRHKDPPDES